MQPTSALYAGAAYVEILALPGASAHQAFAAMLLRAALKQLLRVAPELGAATSASTKKTAKKAAAPASSEGLTLQAQFDEEEDDDEPTLEVTPAVTQASKAMLVALVKLLEAYSLRPTPELLDLAMQVCLNHVEASRPDGRRAAAHRAPQLSYAALTPFAALSPHCAPPSGQHDPCHRGRDVVHRLSGGADDNAVPRCKLLHVGPAGSFGIAEPR